MLQHQTIILPPPMMSLLLPTMGKPVQMTSSSTSVLNVFANSRITSCRPTIPQPMRNSSIKRRSELLRQLLPPFHSVFDAIIPPLLPLLLPTPPRGTQQPHQTISRHQKGCSNTHIMDYVPTTQTFSIQARTRY